MANSSSNSLSLTEKFIRGLKHYGYDSLEAFNKAKFKYHGGSGNESARRYWKLLEGTNPFPEETNECVCGHYIELHFYICSKDGLLTIGCCCILKFIPSGMRRTCEICGDVHRNRKNNLCNGCREGRCVKCGDLCLKKNYKYCSRCYVPNVSRWY
jgi:hypothetical protein